MIAAGIPLDGATDHGVSEAIYLRDPDGNGVELYRDRPRDEWPRTADGELEMVSERLDSHRPAGVSSTLAYGARRQKRDDADPEDPWRPAPPTSPPTTEASARPQRPRDPGAASGVGAAWRRWSTAGTARAATTTASSCGTCPSRRYRSYSHSAAYLLARKRSGPGVVVLETAVAAVLPERAVHARGLHPPGRSPAAPLWYDALMLASFAWTAFVLGFASLYLMQMIWQRAAGACGRLARGARGAGARKLRRLPRPLPRLQQLGRRWCDRAAWIDVIRTDLENPLQHPRLLGSLARPDRLADGGVCGALSFAGARLDLDRR